MHDRNQILAENTVRAETKLAREANAARDKNAFMVIVRGNVCVPRPRLWILGSSNPEPWLYIAARQKLVTTLAAKQRRTIPFCSADLPA